MSMIFLTYRAQTGARRGVSILNGAGIRARMGRTPGNLATEGCGFGLWIREADGHRAAYLLRRGSAAFERCYKMEGGRGREVAL